MTLSPRTRTGIASLLVAMTCVLATGVPSHHHESHHDSDGVVRIEGADHHAHGTLLVEQPERVPSSGPELATLSAVWEPLVEPAERIVFPAPSDAELPRERAPPPGAPRAPPHLS